MDDTEYIEATDAMQAMSLDVEGEFDEAFMHYPAQAYPAAADDPFANQMQMTSTMFPDGIPQPDDFAAYPPDVMGGNDGSNAAQDDMVADWTAGGDWVQPAAPQRAPSTSNTLATHDWTTGATWTNAGTHTAQTFESATIAYSVTDDIARQESYNPPTEYTTGPFIPLSLDMSLRITATAGGEKGLKLKDSLSFDHDLTGDVLIEALKTLCAMYHCTEQMNQTIESSKNVIRHSRRLLGQRHAWRKVYRHAEACTQNVAQIEGYLAGTQSQADLPGLMRPLVKHLYRTHQNAVADEGGTFEDLWLYCGVHCTCPDWSDKPQLLHAGDQQS